MAIKFSTADCDVFARNPKKVKWPDGVSEADRKIFIDIRDRVQQLAKELASKAKLSVGLKPLTSLYEVSGRSVTDIWCCVYPSSVPNKSYAFQVALIISQHGAEMCFCAGAGRAEIRDPKKARELQGMFNAAKQRLASIPPGIVASVENALEGKWFYRKSFREKNNQQEFDSLSDWITYASSPQGDAASLSIYFDPNELTKIGDQIGTQWARALEIFAPLLEFAYGNSPGNRYWIFQGNPRLFGVDEYIRTRDEIRWSVRQHADLIHDGDMVLMWRSGENAGVVAVCLVQSEPDRLLPEDAPEIWHQKPPETEMRCKLKVLERFLDHPVSREAIGAVLPNLTIIRAPQGTNFSLTRDEYAKILSLRNQQPESSLAEILRRYHDQQIVFQSSAQKRHYAIGSVDNTGASVERLDADKPERVTFAQAEKILQRLQSEGQLEFTSIDDTAAVRNAILQAEPVALSADQKNIHYLADNAARLANFLQVLGNLRMADPLYKPAMLLCVLDGLDSHNLLANEIPFDWIAPRFIDKMKSLGREVTEQQAAQPFYHLYGDLFWMHAVKDLKDLMQDGKDGPKAAREKVKYALLKDTYWNLLQDPTSRTAVRKKLESIMPTSTSAPELPPARNIILYGPPGTGKTYTLRKRYMEIFTDRQVIPTSEEQARALVQGLSWWEIAALTLLDVKDHRASVSEMIAHPLVKTRGSLSANKNVRSTLWRVLQMHTKAECETVKVAARNEPLLFSKDKESIWSIDERVAKIEAPELEKWLNEFHNPTKQTIPITHRYKFTTFHQSFSYEDFIEGIKPQMEDQEDGQIAYEIRDGIFKEICQRAEADPAKPYALLIDEINRGNVASIFGELITLIEDDKRLGAENELKAVLPYSRKEFGVPGNLYIIGTMNTADRSVEALDTALRRRFTFEEMRPDSDRIQTPDNLGVDLRKLFDRINARLEQLLDHDHCIGHAYFMEIKSLDDLRVVFANKIIPLLKEYFYGNPAKIGMVLGEPFIVAKKMKTAFASGDWGADELDEKAVYEFADVSQLRADAFASIYA